MTLVTHPFQNSPQVSSAEESGPALPCHLTHPPEACCESPLGPHHHTLTHIYSQVSLIKGGNLNLGLPSKLVFSEATRAIRPHCPALKPLRLHLFALLQLLELSLTH